MRIIGIGTAVVECLRIAHLIEKHGEVFLARVFTPREIQFCSSRRHATQHYTAHWAGKQAALRALQSEWTDDMQWREIEFQQTGDGPPELVLEGQSRQRARRLGAARWHVSLAHCRMFATGYVLAADE